VGKCVRVRRVNTFSAAGRGRSHSGTKWAGDQSISENLLLLDFSHLSQSGEGRSPPIHSKREAISRRLHTPLSLTWATKLTLAGLSKRLLSLRVLARLAGFGSLSFSHRVPFSSSCARREEVVSVCEGFRDFLRVGRLHQPAKSLTGIQGTLRDALCCAAQWLKSSF
jgi:hypothetical protein